MKTSTKSATYNPQNSKIIEKTESAVNNRATLGQKENKMRNFNRIFPRGHRCDHLAHTPKRDVNDRRVCGKCGTPLFSLAELNKPS